MSEAQYRANFLFWKIVFFVLLGAIAVGATVFMVACIAMPTLYRITSGPNGKAGIGRARVDAVTSSINKQADARSEEADKLIEIRQTQLNVVLTFYKKCQERVDDDKYGLAAACMENAPPIPPQPSQVSNAKLAAP